MTKLEKLERFVSQVRESLIRFDCADKYGYYSFCGECGRRGKVDEEPDHADDCPFHLVME